MALVFEKPSARTRNSSELAVTSLGGHPVYIQGSEVGLDTRESTEDVARTLACYHRVLCAWVMEHQTLVRMAAALGAAGVDVPVVNLLSDRAHPCQALADLLTLRHRFGVDGARGRRGGLHGRRQQHVPLTGHGGPLAGIAVRIASPAAGLARRGRGASAAAVGTSGRPTTRRGGGGAGALYTDVWTSWARRPRGSPAAAFAGFAVDDAPRDGPGPTPR